MSTQEKQKLKQTAFTEAWRYIDNAKDALKKAGKQEDYYQDAKYVRSASGAAYNGMLIALDTFLKLKDIPLPRTNKKSIYWYRDNIGKLDRKLLNELNTVYHNLHILGYYEGELNSNTIQIGMEKAISIINRIKPSN